MIIWNKGPLPGDAEAWGAAPDSAPVRFRPMPTNSLLNRFEEDPALRTRAVLTFDDDVLTTCADVEAGFAAWRADPDGLVGMFPRLLSVDTYTYHGEATVFASRSFNVLLTGALFLDGPRYFAAARQPWHRSLRHMVERRFNCEDLFLNFAAAEDIGLRRRNASDDGGLSITQEHWHFLRPRRRLDASKLTLASRGISANSAAHGASRDACAHQLLANFGNAALAATPLPADTMLPPCLPGIGCIYL